MRTFAVAVLLLPLAGCGGDEVVGEWDLPDNAGSFEFRSDGTMTVHVAQLNMTLEGTWERVDATHIRTAAGQPLDQGQTVGVTVSGNTMTVTEADGSTKTYTRR